jgi:hypothetical protein
MKDLVAIKFEGLSLVVLDSHLNFKKLNKVGDVMNANLICAMHA